MEYIVDATHNGFEITKMKKINPRPPTKKQEQKKEQEQEKEKEQEKYDFEHGFVIVKV